MCGGATATWSRSLLRLRPAIQGSARQAPAIENLGGAGSAAEPGNPGGIKGNTGPGGSVNSFHASNTIIASNTSDQGRPDCSGRVVDGAGAHNLLKPQVAA